MATVNKKYAEQEIATKIAKVLKPKIVCEICEDSGFMDHFEYDADSNNHYRDGVQRCFCQFGEKYSD